MKRYILIISLFFCLISYSQNNFNYYFTINTTFTTNESFGEYDEYYDEVDWSLLAPRAIILRNGIDVNVTSFLTAGINLGFDWHPDLEVLAIPYYLNSKIAIFQMDDDKFYFTAGVGKLLKISRAFDRGKYYTAGIGYYISTMKNYSVIINMDFHQKKIANFKNGKLNSLSFGLGMSFL
ncbi:hypothetical protein [Lutibacter citreus]|uniref:hypothetical protein n=1 Tax=Lutibacter citreus TaxID=2138210 RepID=UPI000DBE34A6|nr:hypothetical protein [Lutibacter citreus]